MNTCCHNVVPDNWKQVRFEVEWGIPQQCINKAFRSSIPVSGILYDGIQSYSGILVSALPERSTAGVPDEWRASEIPTTIVSYDGLSLSALGFQGQSKVAFRISPFVRQVNPDMMKHAFAPTSFVPTIKADGDITADSFCITGVRYEPQKNISTSTAGFKFLTWVGFQLNKHSSEGVFTIFIVKVEQGSQVSFWGAPVLTADEKISSIVVHQRNLTDGAVAIVGMKIKSFIDSIPLLSTRLVSI